MNIINFLSKCEYFRFNGNYLNALFFNVNSGSAHETHTLVFFLQLFLSEYILMPAFARLLMPRGWRWGGGTSWLLEWWCWNYLWSKIWRHQKCYKWLTCSEIWGRPGYLGLIFLVFHGRRHFLGIKFFITGQLIISWANHLGSDNEQIKVLVWIRTVLHQKS